MHDVYGLAIDDAGALTPLALSYRAQAIADTLFYDQQLPNPMFGIVPANVTFGNPSISRQNLLRPYPEFNGITANTIPKVHYRYDALQLSIQKRAFSSKSAGAMTFVLSYTFSKGYEQNHRLNTWNYVEPLIYEVDNQDKPQNIAFSGTWDLPLGTGRKFANVNNRVGKALVNDWRFTWIYTYYSGWPVGWPDLVNSCPSWHYTGTDNPFDHWFNNDKTCYKTRPANTPRVVPDRFPDIRNPAEPQMNLALEKTFHLTERYSMLIRGESFNVTNTPVYGGPSTSFTDPRFGQIPLGQENFPRFMQIAAKFIF